MKMNEEKMMILKMLQEGKISADEAAKLLESVESGEKKGEKEEVSHKGQGKFFRVKITDTDTGKSRANIRIPLSVLGFGVKLGAKFTPEVSGIDQQQLMEAINSGQIGQIMDVYDDKDGEHVEIFIE